MKCYPNSPVNAVTDTYDDLTIKELRGLTKREYFAGLAMQGILAAEPADLAYNETLVASRAISFADALIEALNKEV